MSADYYTPIAIGGSEKVPGTLDNGGGVVAVILPDSHWEHLDETSIC